MEDKPLWVFFNIIISLVIIIIGINLLLNVDLTKSIDLNGETNDFCQTFNKSDNSLDYLACDNKFRKKKIILLMIDSLPFDKLHELAKTEQSKLTNFFRGKGLDYKQSGALFETILTGKFSRNYIANSATKFDTLAQQFENAGMDIYYKIRGFPLGQLINKELLKKFDAYEGEIIPLSRFCEKNSGFYENYLHDEIEKTFIDESISGFKKDLNEDKLYEVAHKDLKDKIENIHLYYDKCFKRYDFSSLLFYTECLDHFIHVSHKHHPTVIFNIFYIEQIVKEIIKWINEEHEEYALGVVSDHGGQEFYGEDALCNHGCNRLGNEAIIFLYTKELGLNYEKYKTIKNNDVPIININDFSCIVTQGLKNVNLPLESECTPRYIGNDPIIKFSSIKSKEVQLRKYIEKLCNKYPELKNKYYEKYNGKLKNHKFNEYFKDEDSINKAPDNIFDEYRDYIMEIQDNLLNEVIKSSQSTAYYLIFYFSLISFISAFLYQIRKVVLITKNIIIKELTNEETNSQISLSQEENKNEKILISKLVKYILIIVIISLLDPIICLIFHNTNNISPYINASAFLKYISYLILVIVVAYIYNFSRNKNYKKIIYIIIIIILMHLFMCYIELYSFIDKNINNQTKSDILKIYISYPLFVIYAGYEFYYHRNYFLFISKKVKIKYNHIIIPYLIFLSFYMVKFDVYVKQRMSYHRPETISLMFKIYFMIFSLILFIKPLKKKKSTSFVIPDVIFNTKLFLFVMINFLCLEIERVQIILLFSFVLFYLCNSFKKEKDAFLKMIYIVIILHYSNIFFVGNQGTYTLDSSIKIEVKCPAKWADDLPIVIGTIFSVHKYKYYLFSSAFMFSLYKRNNTKNNKHYFNQIIRSILIIQFIGICICFLYFMKKGIQESYIQILFLVAAKGLPLICYDINNLINIILFKLINRIYRSKDQNENFYERINNENNANKFNFNI